MKRQDKHLILSDLNKVKTNPRSWSSSKTLILIQSQLPSLWFVSRLFHSLKVKHQLDHILFFASLQKNTEMLQNRCSHNHLSIFNPCIAPSHKSKIIGWSSVAADWVLRGWAQFFLWRIVVWVKNELNLEMKSATVLQNT